MDAAAEVLGIHLTLFQRILFVWAFIAVGLVICFQLASFVADEPPRWTRLTKENRLTWYTVYVLETFLFVQSAHPLLKKNMEPFADGNEQRILNTVYIGLLGLETLMVLGVAVQGLVKRFGPRPKQKTN
ncbi:hypothetical protein B0I35DRAFT_411849 [Stachybotrys elegans]|uniref:Uncharacterized protein n=1 Tax=Stachybotrys elegans TaxID=80388 RepID=A0A8K0SGS9_9HYPO|nr:hypothetical protein B0I35DRAFT_411849 [Stachybotrys elegans]